MSIIQPTQDTNGAPDNELLEINRNKKGDPTDEKSAYQPTDDEKDVRSLIVDCFRKGDLVMRTPRYEFNDLTVIDRMMVDQMAFNTYQPNNGDSLDNDLVNSWKSRAIRPVVRNKCISIAAHATARLIFPKVFAYNEESDEQESAAQVMMDLMEWAADKSDYADTSLRRTISALTDPASIGYTEYAEIYKTVKTEKDPKTGRWKTEKILDQDFSGFQDIVVPCDELYIENFYEPDIQKQGWLIWRRVHSYSYLEKKYGHLPNFEYVKPGIQLVYNDANTSFYNVYDPNMRADCGEEIIFWNKTKDLRVVMVNGVVLSDFDNPNPRNDKLYPFDKFGYELINNRCFYYKSLAFKMGPDASIINTLYPMIIDGTYLNVMPPMINVGEEVIASDVIVPGAVTTLTSPEADLRAITLSQNLKAGMDALMKVEENVNESSQDPIQGGQSDPGSQTAYEISRLEQNATTVLGLFIKMISSHVKSFGRLRIGDILQFLTIGEVSDLEDDPELIYKTFLIHNKVSNGTSKTRKIKFDAGMSSDPMSDEDMLDESYDVMIEQGGHKSKTELFKVNPELFRELYYILSVSPDVINPMSEDLERAFNLEEYDRLIANPLSDQEEALRLLLHSYPKTRKDPDKYISKNPQPQQGQDPNAAPNDPMNPQKGQPTPAKRPSMLKQNSALPQSPMSSSLSQ